MGPIDTTTARTRTRFCWLLGLGAGYFVLACRSSQPQPDNGVGGEARCEGSCESSIWGRVIVGLIPAEAGAQVEGIALQAIGSNGEQAQVYDRGCPSALPKRFICSFSSLGGDVGSPFTDLEFSHPASQSSCARERVNLAPYNPCGRDIAYVTALVGLDGGRLNCEFLAPQFINPCAADWNDP